VNHLLLDLDGTLLASSGRGLRMNFVSRSIRYLRRRGISSWKALKAIHQMRKALESPGAELTNEQRACQAFARALQMDEAEARSLMHGMVGEVFPTLREHFSEIPGAREFVDWAGSRYALTLATNPVWPREIVDLRLSWAGIDPSRFGYITHAGVMRACKPCVEYYRELLVRLELEPGSALMVGDSRRKDGPAEKAGIKVFLVSEEGFTPLKGMLAERGTA
jgi:FMN phosphatase YigB (HAD superfamily)